MAYSSINTSKHGDCARCGDKDTQCKKRGKELLCFMCCRKEDAEKQKKKANQKQYLKAKLYKNISEDNNELGSIAALKMDLDHCFQRIVKITAADAETGLVTCYTCPNVFHWSMPSVQCGHYISRKVMLLRWDFRNAKVQCKTCNELLEGNMEVYTERLEAEHKGLPDQLREISTEIFKWDRDSLKQLLLDMRAKLRIIETKFKTQ